MKRVRYPAEFKAEAVKQVTERGHGLVDAAIAVQGVLALVEPQSSRLVGGVFLIHVDGKQFDGARDWC